MTDETKGVSAELVDQWHLAWRDVKHQPRALDYIAQRAYEKGLADGMERAARKCLANLSNAKAGSWNGACFECAASVRASIGEKP